MNGNGEWMGALALGFVAVSIAYAVLAGVVWAFDRVWSRRAAR